MCYRVIPKQSKERILPFLPMPSPILLLVLALALALDGYAAFGGADQRKWRRQDGRKPPAAAATARLRRQILMRAPFVWTRLTPSARKVNGRGKDGIWMYVAFDLQAITIDRLHQIAKGLGCSCNIYSLYFLTLYFVLPYLVYMYDSYWSSNGLRKLAAANVPRLVGPSSNGLRKLNVPLLVYYGILCRNDLSSQTGIFCKEFLARAVPSVRLYVVGHCQLPVASSVVGCWLINNFFLGKQQGHQSSRQSWAYRICTCTRALGD